MLEHYPHIRMAPKRVALEGIAKTSEAAVFQADVNQNVHQLAAARSGASSKSLN